MQKHSTLRSILTQLGREFVKVTPRCQTTAITEIEFIRAVAPEYLRRSALVASTLDGETLVLVKSVEPQKWHLYATFVNRGPGMG